MILSVYKRNVAFGELLVQITRYLNKTICLIAILERENNRWIEGGYEMFVARKAPWVFKICAIYLLVCIAQKYDLLYSISVEQEINERIFIRLKLEGWNEEK